MTSQKYDRMMQEKLLEEDAPFCFFDFGTRSPRIYVEILLKEIIVGRFIHIKIVQSFQTSGHSNAVEAAFIGFSGSPDVTRHMPKILSSSKILSNTCSSSKGGEQY
eukprot:CAMPEP_0201555456 /NCGR_PEP_ID=MMETSP0173_2-20130828/49116_1 /ASSEMBLY_ACC=CAM_ASM_000268 /TAXON_ID=218659 /ORGANISM="Vexillifera sp., Strain DIVA3 564/2" /LENGTH=105 /DNA_ID=CAMNT_0047967259 /DNA_START=765 /DNA_END=1079 /DNA_ORIENTATION=-